MDAFVPSGLSCIMISSEDFSEPKDSENPDDELTVILKGDFSGSIFFRSFK